MSWNRVARRRSSAKVVPGGADDEHLAGKAAVAAASAKLHAAIARGKARADSDSSSSGTCKDGSPGNTPRPQRGPNEECRDGQSRRRNLELVRV